jgi:hypothetical protein
MSSQQKYWLPAGALFSANLMLLSEVGYFDLAAHKREPQEATLSALITELGAAGIVFTETGVEFLEWPPRPYVPTGCTTIKKRAKRRWCRRTLHAIS